jgi:hypothetical protein
MQLLIIAMLVLFLGCAGTTPPTDSNQIPTGCENALVYKIQGFMPNGPMIARVTASTALALSATAGHSEVKMIVATTMPILYRATLENRLAGAMEEVKAKFKVPQMVNYVTPFLVLFDSLNQAGIINSGKVGLTDCDKNVLASLFKNIGLDSGTDPLLFQ